MSYVQDLNLPSLNAIPTELDKAKILRSCSLRRIPFNYKDADKLKASSGLTLVKVGHFPLEFCDNTYSNPVAIMFAPPKMLQHFSYYFYDGKPLHEHLEVVDKIMNVSNGRNGDSIGDDVLTIQLDKYFYRVDYVADRSGMVPINIEVNPADPPSDVLYELKKRLQ